MEESERMTDDDTHDDTAQDDKDPKIYANNNWFQHVNYKIW